MKIQTKIAVGVLFTLGAGALWAVTAAAGARIGPVQCTDCQLGLPAPDASTKVFLESFASIMGRPRSITNGHPVSTGDVIIVCNASGCVDYEKTLTDHYEGTRYRQQTTNPPKGGGGGKGGGGTGGGTGNSGGIGVGDGGSQGGGGKGKVTVGPIKGERPR